MSKISRRDQSIGRKEKVNQHHPLRSPQASEEGKNGGGMPFSTERSIPTACEMYNVQCIMMSPGMIMETPGMIAVPPGMITETPGMIAEPPGMIAETPGMIAESPGMIAETPGMIIKSKMMLIHRKKELNPPCYPMGDWKSPLQKRELSGKGVHKMKNVKCTMKNEVIGVIK